MVNEQPSVATLLSEMPLDTSTRALPFASTVTGGASVRPASMRRPVRAGKSVAGTFVTDDAAGEGEVTPKYLPPAGNR
jgi:hypothetical protein